SINGQTTRPAPTIQVEEVMPLKNQGPTTADGAGTKEKLQQAVDSMNEFFEINNSGLKFVFHEGLEKYYVQLVNKDTDEVVREIPSKKMLDVFYEMQKLVGMIVDEKI
ncbi:MAG: flagellar protein FlaG, partial [Priestia megaterium]